jgi:hypothetical protein
MAIENIGYNLLLNTNGSKTDKYRGDMLKVAIALFGEREEWKNAVSNEFLWVGRV